MNLAIKLQTQAMLTAFFLILPNHAWTQETQPLLDTCMEFEEIDVIPQPDNFTVSEALTLTDTILDTVGLSRNFQVVAAYGIDNAQAVIRRGKGTTGIGERFLIYDPKWMRRTFNESRWSLIAVLAHEIGHHLQGHTLDCIGSTPPKEIEADRFAGNVLGRLGASKAEAVEMWEQMPDVESTTHPPRTERIVAVLEGWERGRRQSTLNEFDIYQLEVKNCVYEESILRFYFAEIDPTGRSGSLRQIISNRTSLPNNRIVYNYRFDSNFVYRSSKYEDGHIERYKHKIEGIELQGSSVIVKSVTINQPGVRDLYFIDEFHPDGTGKSIYSALLESAGEQTGRFREATATFHSCNYAGAPGFWEQ